MKTVGANNTKLDIPLPVSESVHALRADVETGVRAWDMEFDLDDFRECYTAVDGEDFYKALPGCGVDQIIVCSNVSKEWRDRIKDEYGIN